MSYPKPRLNNLGSGKWEFEFPGLMEETIDKFYDATEEMEGGSLSRAKRMLLSVIDEYPVHIDAMHHLAMVYDMRRRKNEAFALWENAVKTGKACFPKSFKSGRDRLEWGFLDNRPFLRACHGLGLALMKRCRIEEALSIFNWMLDLNPDDNQGIRALAIDCNFMLKKPEGVLEICEKYKNDGMADTLYGRGLAMFQLGRKEEAEKALGIAVESSPKIANELLKKKHVKPKDMLGGHITSGGEDEAYEYWETAGKFWESAKGALEILKEIALVQK